MIDSLSTKQMKHFIRSFLGGLISALIAAIFILISFSIDTLLWAGFYFPVFVISPPSFEITIISIVAFWFVIGFVSTYVTRKITMAILLWLIFYIVFLVIGILLIFAA